jgi:hypothetical protein
MGLALILAACPARALDLGPKAIPLTIAGVSLEIPVIGTLDARADAKSLAVSATATGDLSAIQDNALEIARGLKLPRDSCARDGVNIVVKSLDEASLTPDHAQVVVEIAGRAAVWACTKLFGAAMKTRIAEDSFRITAPLEIYLPTKRSIGLRLTGPAKLETGNAIAADAARAFGKDVDALLTAQLGKLLDTSRARASVPDLPGLDATIASASLGREGAKLTIRASGRATMTSEAFAALAGYLAK